MEIRLHVVGNIDGIQLIGEESIAEVHSLLLTSTVDWNDA